MKNECREVLLVIPEQVVAEVTAFRLELLGYRVICVDSAEAAFARITESIPDLVITDLVLPALDGLGFIERLTTDEVTSDLRILVLSIDADLSKVQAAYGVGARDFIVVPFHPEVLEDKVSKLLEEAPVIDRAVKTTSGEPKQAEAQPVTAD